MLVIDLGSGTVFGPYPGGTAIKYTQAPGKTPNEEKIGSTNGQAGAVSTHITGTGDFQIVPVERRPNADLPGTSTSEVIRRQPRRLGSGGPSSCGGPPDLGYDTRPFCTYPWGEAHGSVDDDMVSRR